MGRGERYFGALREQQFRLLYFGQSVSAVGGRLNVIALPFAVLAIGGSATDVGLVQAAYLVPLAIMLLLGGVWADRLPRRLVMLASDLARAALQVGLAAVLILGDAQVWHLAVFQMGLGFSEAFFQPAYFGLVPQTVSRERLHQANALTGLTNSVSTTIGGVAGGLLVAGVGAGWTIGIDAATYLVSAAFLLLMRPIPASIRRRPPGFLTDLREGWSAFRSRTWLWAMVLGVAVFLMTVQSSFYVLGPIVTETSYDGARTWGFLAAALGVGQVAGASLALRWEPRRPLVVVAGSLWLSGLPLLLLGLQADVWLLLIGGGLLGVVWGLIHPVWITTLQHQIPEDMLSRVSSYDYLGGLLAYPIGLAAVGPIADGIGISTVLLVSAGCAVAVTVALLSVPSIRGLRAEVQGPADAQST